MVGKMPDHASIVGPVKVLQHQASEQLVLRKLLGTIRMRVERQDALGRRPSHILRTHPTKRVKSAEAFSSEPK